MKPTISLAILLATLFGSLALLNSSNPVEVRRDFKIGVWYDVTIDNAGHPPRFSGELLEINKDWVVLGSAWTEEVQMPSRWLQKLPLADQLAPWLVELPIVGDWCYESRVVGSGTKFVQVRRCRARMHFAALDNTGTAHRKIDATPPTLLLNCNVVWFDQGEQNGHSDRIDLAENEFDARTYAHEHRVENFMDGQCPLVGDALSSRIDCCHQIDKRVSMAEVIYIESRTPSIRPTHDTPLTAAD